MPRVRLFRNRRVVSLLRWVFLALTFILCAMNFYVEDQLWVARTPPAVGFMSMQSPDYACIYYKTGCENVRRSLLHSVWRYAAVHLGASDIRK